MTVLQKIDEFASKLVRDHQSHDGLKLELRKVEIDQLSSDKTMHLLAHRHPTGSVTISFYYEDRSKS